MCGHLHGKGTKERRYSGMLLDPTFIRPRGISRCQASSTRTLYAWPCTPLPWQRIYTGTTSMHLSSKVILRTPACVCAACLWQWPQLIQLRIVLYPTSAEFVDGDGTSINRQCNLHRKNASWLHSWWKANAEVAGFAGCRAAKHSHTLRSRSETMVDCAISTRSRTAGVQRHYRNHTRDIAKH